MTNTALPWWEALPEDYYARAEGTELDRTHPLSVKSTAALDKYLRTILAVLITGGLGSAAIKARGLAADFDQLEFYKPFADRGDADAVFGANPQTPDVSLGASRFVSLRHRDIRSRLMRFRSSFTTLNPELNDTYQARENNRTVFTQLWRHKDGPRKTLLFLHGYSGDFYWFNAAMFSLGWFYKSGYDVALMTLPFHGPRAEKRDPFSGFGFMAGGMAHMNEAMLQSVHDARTVISWLHDEGAPSVGVSGLSLGGYITSLLAVSDDRPDYCIPNSPVVSTVDLGLEWAITKQLFWAMRKFAGKSIVEMRHGQAVHSPMSYPLKIAPEKVLMIAGAGDRFTPPRYVRALHEHWPGSRLHWFPGNHLIHLQQKDYLYEMMGHMDAMTHQ